MNPLELFCMTFFSTSRTFFRSLETWSGAQEPNEEQRSFIESSGTLSGAQEINHQLRNLIPNAYY